MAGETVRAEATCLAIRSWSRTSHIVTWLTDTGRLGTVVRGAERPKSFFLGQYDLNYTCDLVYYARARGDLHALRECVPVSRRDELRRDWRALALADYFRHLAGRLAPAGREAVPWRKLLDAALDGLCARSRERGRTAGADLARLIRYELDILGLAGLAPDFSGNDPKAEWSAFSIEKGAFSPNGGRIMRLRPSVAEYLRAPDPDRTDLAVPLDAARVISVFYAFHLDAVPDVRRTVLEALSKPEPATSKEKART